MTKSLRKIRIKPPLKIHRSSHFIWRYLKFIYIKECVIFSNFGIWNFDNLIFLDIENINFWIYMYVILVGQALVFLLGVCVGGSGGGGVLNILCQKRRMSCTWELNMLLLLRFKSCGEEEQHVFVFFIFNRIKSIKNIKMKVSELKVHTQLEDKCIS